jgi:arylsulfatase A-like enzyme
MIGRLFTWLEAKNILDDTAIVHSSDHGYFLGEYRCFDKRLMHEPSIRVPIMICYPKLFKAGTVKDEMVLDLDLASTLLEIAGLKPRSEMQGTSLLPFRESSPATWRREWFYDYYEYPGAEDFRPHRGVGTETKKRMNFYTMDEQEMYDSERSGGETEPVWGAGVRQFTAGPDT